MKNIFPILALTLLSGIGCTPLMAVTTDIIARPTQKDAAGGAQSAVVLPERQHPMVQETQPAFDNQFTNMAAVSSFVNNTNNNCDVNPNLTTCYKMLTALIGTPTTTGTTQCPQGFSLVLMTSIAIQYKEGNNIVSNDRVVYTSEDTRTSLTDAMVNFYIGKKYSCGIDTNHPITLPSRYLQKGPESGQTQNDLNALCWRGIPYNSTLPVPTIAGTFTVYGVNQAEAFNTTCYWRLTIAGTTITQPVDPGFCGTNPYIAQSYWTFYCQYSGYAAKCTRPAGYYYYYPEDQAYLPTPAANPISGPTVSICVKKSTSNSYWKQMK